MNPGRFHFTAVTVLRYRLTTSLLLLLFLHAARLAPFKKDVRDQMKEMEGLQPFD